MKEALGVLRQAQQIRLTAKLNPTINGRHPVRSGAVTTPEYTPSVVTEREIENVEIS